MSESLEKLLAYFKEQAQTWEEEQKRAGNDYQIGFTKAAALTFKSCASLLAVVIENNKTK